MSQRYPPALLALHWLTLLLVIAAYALVELKGFAERGSDLRSAMVRLHYMAGLSIFALTLLRLGVRAVTTVPASEPLPPYWMQLSSKAVHLVLYAILIALPLLGWLALSAKAQPVDLFFFELPLAPFDLDSDLAKPLRAWHARVANTGYFLIGFHATAALVHHYFLRDNTLMRMLPRSKP